MDVGVHSKVRRESILEVIRKHKKEVEGMSKRVFLCRRMGRCTINVKLLIWMIDLVFWGVKMMVFNRVMMQLEGTIWSQIVIKTCVIVGLK